MKKQILAMALMLLTGMSCSKKASQPAAELTAAHQVIRINCLVEVTPEMRDSVVALTRELVEASRQDSGNIDYDLYESATHPNSLIIFETWPDQASLDKHSAAPHFTRLVPQIQAASEMTIQVFTGEGEKDEALRLNCMVNVPAENRDKAITLYKELVEASQSDEGMIHYDLYLSMTDSTKMMVFETWENQAALDKHSAAPHFTRLVPQLGEIVQSTLQKFNMPKAE